jgi:hypothetical protein
VHASVQGASHVASGLPCQDCSRVTHLAGGWILLVAADGAGSASHAEVGARTACLTITERAVHDATAGAAWSTLSEDRLADWVGAAADAVHAKAQAMGVATRELASTLLVALAGPLATHVAQIGDGAIVARAHDVTGVVTWPQQGEYANTTHFLTCDDYATHLQVNVQLPPVQAIAVFTDGLQHLLLDFATHSAHVPFFDGVFRHLEFAPADHDAQIQRELSAYLTSPALRSKADDDLTLVVALRRAQ